MSYWLKARHHLSKQSLDWNTSNYTNTYAPITGFLLRFCYGNTKVYWLHSGIKAQLDGCKHTITYNTFIFETCLTVAAKKINVWGPARLTFIKQNNLLFLFFFPLHSSHNFTSAPLWSHDLMVLRKLYKNCIR